MLAAYAGLHRTYVGSVERGERNVTLRNIVLLAHALDTTASTLIADAESLKDDSQICDSAENLSP